MAQKLDNKPQEQQRARAERQELKAELAEQAAHRPRRPGNHRRTITLLVIAIVYILAALFSVLTLLPSATSSSGGVPVGTAAPEFTLPVYSAGRSGMIDLHALRGHPGLLNFWSESCLPCRRDAFPRAHLHPVCGSWRIYPARNRPGRPEGGYWSLWQGV